MMNHTDLLIPATIMRGGSSKGLFFLDRDLPVDSSTRERIYLNAMGSPDPYGKQIDGLGGGTSSTSKVAVISASTREGYDVDYLFAHVAIDQAMVDYSGNCGNLSSAVGVFAIENDLVVPRTPITQVHVWQVNTKQHMVIHVPYDDAKVISAGDYVVAGVAGSGAAIKVEFLQHDSGNGPLILPTGNASENLHVPGVGEIRVTLLNSGNPTVFVGPESIGMIGTELPDTINSDREILAKVEKIRCAASVAMGLTLSIEEAGQRPGTPKLACVSRPIAFTSTQGVSIGTEAMDVCARIFSMGRLHHAFTGTGAIAVAVAAAIQVLW